jgi:hypothetical protein
MIDGEEYSFMGTQLRRDDEWQSLSFVVGQGQYVSIPIYQREHLFLTFTRGGKVFSSQVNPFTLEYTDLERYPTQPSQATSASVSWRPDGVNLDWLDASALDRGQAWLMKHVSLENGLSTKMRRLDLSSDPIDEHKIVLSDRGWRLSAYESVRGKRYVSVRRETCE